MGRAKPGVKARSAEYAAQLEDGTWACTRDGCDYTGPNRGAVQLHQRSHAAHKHKWRLLQPRGDEARAIGLGFAKVCETCDELE